MTDTQWLDATEQAALVRSGEVSSRELVQDAIERIERLNPALNAVCYRRFEQALEDARTPPGDAPFAGVPTLIKHLEASAGEPHDRSTEVLKAAGAVAAEDSVIARKFREAGFISVGRSTAPEFGLVSTTESRAYGVTRNPWRTDLTSGGSSGGASAAVAAGMVPVAQAGDGGGSTRMPASFCNLVGLKPSVGLVDVGSLRGDRWGHSVPSVLTHSVRDTAGIFDAISQGMEPGSTRVPPRRGGLLEALRRRADPLRIGFLVQAPDHAPPLHPAVRDAVLSTAKLLEEAGHSVQESAPEALSDPRTLAMFFDALSVTAAQAVDSVREQLGRYVPIDDFDPITAFWDRRGREISGLGLADALTWQNRLRARMGQWWADGFDLLLAPVFATPPRPLGWPWATPEGLQESVDVLTYTAPFNTTGQPAIAVPAAVTVASEPIGIQLVAGYGREDLLVQVAGQLEARRPWAHRHPNLACSPG